MRIAVISDIHGNLAAFEEVLEDIDRAGIHEIFSLGDQIGYGPEPEEVVKLLRHRAIPSVMGNHELGLVDKSRLAWFNPLAKSVLLQTEKLLSSDTLAFIRTLPATLHKNECLFVHGCPPDQIDRYLFELTLYDLRALFREMEEEICFVGHTHELGLISYIDGLVRREPLRMGSTPLKKNHKYIVNAGSVGQPRAGNNNAKYVIWDPERRNLDVRFIPYPIQKTVDKIITVGFPRSFADRLW
jgi:predicted phosphodiesterase